MAEVVLAVLAHPDDAEFLCAGTLLRLHREHGCEVHIASMTAGDCGSVVEDAQAIGRRRRGEGMRAAAMMGASYHCLEEKDLLVFYNERTLEKVTRFMRLVRPGIVFTHSPTDYMLDHEMTSTIVRAAAFAGPVPNFLPRPGQAPTASADTTLTAIPHLYYCDPIEGKDSLGRPLDAGFRIDISTVIDNKAAMLTAHASQRDWLMKHHGMDQYIEAMKDWSARRGREGGVAFAEGFRQHLGHSYPQDNIIGAMLGIC